MAGRWARSNDKTVLVGKRSHAPTIVVAADCNKSIAITLEQEFVLLLALLAAWKRPLVPCDKTQVLVLAAVAFVETPPHFLFSPFSLRFGSCQHGLA